MQSQFYVDIDASLTKNECCEDKKHEIMTVNVDNDNYRHIENKLTTAAQAIDGNLWK